jgi:hypothetical protein
MVVEFELKNDATKMGAKGRERRIVSVQKWMIWLQGAKKTDNLVACNQIIG